MVGYPMLKHTHLMIGLDLHDEVSPPAVPAPKIPHFVAGALCLPPWGLAGCGKPNGTVWTTNGTPLSQGTDMGFFIPHIPIPPAPANLIAPILSFASGSKSHFGAHSRILAQGPAAFACLYVVNTNLNCGGPTWPPLPSGIVLAFWQTTLVDVTFGDLVAGWLHLSVDLFIQFGLNRGFNAATNWLSNRITNALISRANSWLGRALVNNLAQVPGMLMGDVVGSPLGWAIPISPVGWVEGKMLEGQSALARSIDNMLNSPSVEEHPSAAPAPGTHPSPPPAPGSP